VLVWHVLYLYYIILHLLVIIKIKNKYIYIF